MNLERNNKKNQTGEQKYFTNKFSLSINAIINSQKKHHRKTLLMRKKKSDRKVINYTINCVCICMCFWIMQLWLYAFYINQDNNVIIKYITELIDGLVK